MTCCPKKRCLRVCQQRRFFSHYLQQLCLTFCVPSAGFRCWYHAASQRCQFPSLHHLGLPVNERTTPKKDA